MTTHPAALIRPIEATSLRRIVSGQAVTDLASCVKELVDNSIDAQSTSINIRLFQQGLHKVEVSDDGVGVPRESRRLLAAPHATSKIRSMDDIGSSLGFRGEALSSLATLSEKLIIATRTASDSLAEKLEFHRDGLLNEASIEHFPRKIGTTVEVVNLFHTLPVRRGDLKQRIAAQRAKLVSLIESYAIFYPGIRIHLIDSVGRNSQERTILETALNCRSLRETISSVLGPKLLGSLCCFELELAECSVTLSGMISVARQSKEGLTASQSRRLVAVNRRPVDVPKLSRLLNAIWRQRSYSPKEPSWFFMISVPIDQVDVNLTPDKRTIVLTHEEVALKQIVSHVEILWRSQTAGNFVIQQTAKLENAEPIDSDSLIGSVRAKNVMNDADSITSNRFNRESFFSRKRRFHEENQISSQVDLTFASALTSRSAISSLSPPNDVRREPVYLSSTPNNKESIASSFRNLSSNPHILDTAHVQTDNEFANADVIAATSNDADDLKQRGFGFAKFGLEQPLSRKPRASASVKNHTDVSDPLTVTECNATTSEKQITSVLSSALSLVVWESFGNTADIVLAVQHERSSMRDRRIALDNNRQNANTSKEIDGALDSTTLPATTIYLHNSDFSRMRIIGQFNLGFIMTLSEDNHLWILDQHACDEKANFERLYEETVIHEQRLMAPLPIELSLIEEMCVMDNLEVFEKNGFRFQVNHEKPPRHRLSLTALPLSGGIDGRKGVVFGKDDVSALCSMLACFDESAFRLADGAGTGVDGSGVYGNNAVRRYAGGSFGSFSADKLIVRLPKAIAMFASRACRTSIMIGKALSHKEMKNVVARMQKLNDPWTCAHGRPTLRHVSDLLPNLKADERRARAGIVGATASFLTQEDAIS